MKIISVVGTRPNFMKLAPVARELETRPGVEHIIVHTGQHYDADMSDDFFDELDIPSPSYELGVGSGTHTEVTAAVMSRLEPVFAFERPDLVIVYGDVNSTMAAAMAAAQRGIRVAHVEAGLRSRDRTMPEELNRLVTDHIADLLLAPSADAVANLAAEGIDRDKVHFVGNVMIDSLVRALPRARGGRDDRGRRFNVDGPYVVTTLHRPSNVDDPEHLRDLLVSLEELSRETTVLFSMHPRTKRRLEEMQLKPNGGGALRVLDPLGYLDMLGLVSSASLVITDSGGLQEETSFLGVPCITVRPNTERPITCSEGTNELVSPTGAGVLGGARKVLNRKGPRVRPVIERWDGHAAERIADVVCDGARF
ncbi:MAG TPA: UDP-N-acetylglucosamine 2-epimerase (non-hydrolyzing) [Gemmatimonadaceae bacterium]|jgi:UDP-N-acetylglucosamine 2-epimerase (non-hydrolysing)|nr:UDP-N-acetylglucosamine 2-epimerase (non-hydrolyzing) [Gemmatimonadaceae bacterium]